MSRSFLGIPINLFKGSYTSFPIKLCGQSGKVIPIPINWIDYGASSAFPSQNVVINLRGNATVKLLEHVRSVYIDNTGSTNPIYIFFPDTGYTVTAAPGAEVWAPCYTNGDNVWIIGQEFVTGFIPSTLVMFTDVFVQPFTSVELVTAVELNIGSRAVQGFHLAPGPTYSPKALGDISQDYLVTCNGTDVALWATPLVPDGVNGAILYITHLEISASAISNPANVDVRWQISEPGGEVAFLGQFTATPTVQAGVSKLFGPFSGMNVRLNGAKGWKLTAPNIANGTLNCSTVFSVGLR